MRKGSLAHGSRVRRDGGFRTDFWCKVTSPSANTPFQTILDRYHRMFG